MVLKQMELIEEKLEGIEQRLNAHWGLISDTIALAHVRDAVKELVEIQRQILEMNK